MKTDNSLRSFFDDEELKVSDIILDLQNLISESERRHGFSFTWGAKSRRSAIDSNPCPINLSPSPSSSLPSSTPCVLQSSGEAERRLKVKVEATSPSTPLSFLPSESDGKSKHSDSKFKSTSHSKPKKRTREEWLEIIEGLTQRKELLTGEVETVRTYHEKLKAFNLLLKEKKQELSCCYKKEEPNLEKRNVEMKLEHPYQNTMFAHKHHFIFMDQNSQTSGRFQYPHGQMAPLLSPNSGLGRPNQIGPRGIPDLNVRAEETFGVGNSQPLIYLNNNGVVAPDYRAVAAEARRRRIMKLKEMKKSSAAARKSPR